jgi:hypothetical protein
MPDSATPDPAFRLVASHAVIVLESFLDYSPLPVLAHFAAVATPNTSHVIHALAASLHIAAIANLFLSLAPARLGTGLATSSFSLGGTSGNAGFGSSSSFDSVGNTALSAQSVASLQLLASAGVMTLLATVFARSSAQVLQNRVSQPQPPPEVAYDDLQRLQNAADVMPKLLVRLIPVLRLHAASMSTDDEVTRACNALNVYETPASAQAIAVMLDAGTSTLRSSNYTCTDPCLAAVDTVVRVLDDLVEDRGHRVLSLTAQPRAISTSAIDAVLIPRLVSFVDILIDTARVGRGFEACRIRIFDLFVAAQRACNPALVYPALDRIRFSEVAFKLLRLHARNSLLHTIVASSVEVALLSDDATSESRAHWLSRAKIVDKILAAWASDGGVLNWNDPAIAQATPYLSAIIHMACCVQHMGALNPEALDAYVEPSTLDAFNAFCGGPLSTILADETLVLGGSRPPRRRADNRIPLAGSSLPFSNTAGSALRRGSSRLSSSSGVADVQSSGLSACALLLSPSAHRFGFVKPSSTTSTPTRSSRLGSVFVPADSANGDADDSSCNVVSGGGMPPSCLKVNLGFSVGSGHGQLSVDDDVGEDSDGDDDDDDFAGATVMAWKPG